MARVLLIEDDADVREIVRYNVAAAGHQVRAASTGEAGLRMAREELPDVVLLDLLLPDLSGLTVCKRLKADERTRAARVIIVSAKGEEIDRVVGFEIGADDYVVKPFSVRELLLRIQAVAGRARAVEPENHIVFGSLRVDRDAHRVWVEDEEVILTALELRLLVTLYDGQDRVRDRQQILKEVWRTEPDIELRTVDTHVKRLREKLGSAGKYVQTVRGVGYRFSSEPEE